MWCVKFLVEVKMVIASCLIKHGKCIAQTVSFLEDTKFSVSTMIFLLFYLFSYNTTSQKVLLMKAYCYVLYSS